MGWPEENASLGKGEILIRAVSWNPWDNSSSPWRSFHSLCNPLQNESYVSGRGKGCQEPGANNESLRKVMSLPVAWNTVFKWH